MPRLKIKIYQKMKRRNSKPDFSRTPTHRLIHIAGRSNTNIIL